MTATLRLGPLAIEAVPLQTPAALEAAAEAMAELGLPGHPPALWLVEQLAGRLPGVGELIARDRHPLGQLVARVDEPPHVLVELGLPPLVERSIIRHELAHLAQVAAGRLEVFDAGELGRWYVLPAGSMQAIEAGAMPPLEAEAVRFQLDARYWADRIAACLVPPDASWRVSLERLGRGRYDWRLRRFQAGELVEELVPREPSAAAAASMRDAADAFLAAARRDPSIVDRLCAGMGQA